MTEVLPPTDTGRIQSDPVARAKMIGAARRAITTADPLRVLIVEDSPIVLQRLVAMIHRLGRPIRVTTAVNGADAAQSFADLRPEVAVLDIALPGLNGFDLLATFKLKQHECVVIMLTTYAYPEFREHADRMGADFFFSKVREFERVPEVLAALTA